jgi:glycosyltransferase involved in cell wall biosynthesis
VAAIISPSRFLRKVFVETGVRTERIAFSRQGRDFPNLTPQLLTKSPAAHLRVGYSGQIAPHKGVHILFQAARQLPGAALKVRAYGDTSAFPDYARQLEQIARQDARLHLAGVYERTQVSRVLQELDVLVVPSVWYENSPNTILEALAHRTPVIVSNLGGMAELVQDGVNGLRFVPGDAFNLAARLKQLLDEPELLPRLRAGIGPVKSVAEEMTELQGIYQAVVRGERAARQEVKMS